uniref:Putative secreted peptide n=1 Tax=Anopheles braziliensis TaxID=58242 RepID=A0A2M3ZSD6_9DIPT
MSASMLSMALRSPCVPLLAAASARPGVAKRASVEFARGVGVVRETASAGAPFSSCWFISRATLSAHFTLQTAQRSITS